MKDLNERQRQHERERERENTGTEKKEQKEGEEEIFLPTLLTWCQPRLSGLEKHIRDLFAL